MVIVVTTITIESDRRGDDHLRSHCRPGLMLACSAGPRVTVLAEQALPCLAKARAEGSRSGARAR